jgi:hypothetical protein
MAIVPSIIRFEPGGGKGPGILFANRESREESRKHNRLCINMTPPQSYHPIHFAPFGVFINYEVDILHITPMVYAVDPINYRGRDEPGYLNQNAVEHATTDFHRWLRPVRNIIFDVEDFRSLPEGRDEQHLLISIIQLSQLCPTLNKIVLVPKSSYELRYHEMNPNSAPSEVDQSCIDAFQEQLKEFLTMVDDHRKMEIYGLGWIRIDPELVFMKQETDSLSNKRKLPLWELKNRLQDLGVRFWPSDVA